MPVVMGLYGLKQPKPVSQQTLLRYARIYGIPEADSYELDTAFASFLTRHEKAQPAAVKNHSQPLQALYYNQSGYPQAFLINCYADDRFPNIKWNPAGELNVFPPREQAPIDSLLSLDSQRHYLRPFPQTVIFDKHAWDEVVVVYWSRFMGRQSKRLIQAVQTNSRLAINQRVKILYVNNDAYFAQEELKVSR
jgi:hypothetical protein